MKKFLLLICGLSIFAASKATAQTFTVPADTIRVVASSSGNTLVYNNITNISSNAITVSWSVVASNFPSDWIAHMAFCDNHQCYSNYPSPTLWNGTTGATHHSDTISAGSTALFDAQMGLDSVTTAGTYYTDVNLSVLGQSKTVRFIFTRWPTSVSSVSNNAPEVSVYPNPASNQINVVFDPSSDIKTISIYNVIGKMEIVNRVGTQNSAGVNISSLPRGVYFISLRDSEGGLVATRKFIKD